MSRRKSRKQVFENVEVIDAGAKGKTIAKAPDGKVIFLPNAVPGDVVDVQTFNKRKAKGITIWAVNYASGMGIETTMLHPDIYLSSMYVETL